MNLAAACGWTLLRSLLVALAAVPLCWGIRQELAARTGRMRTLLWTLLLIPFFTPALLTGYAYSSFSLSLIRHPGWNEVLYAMLVGLRFLAVGVLVMHFAPPPPVSAEALHCIRLNLPSGTSRWQRISIMWPYLIRGPWRAAFPTAAIMFLFVFQEFETASLMGVTSWTVWLFDAQAGGLMLGRSLRAALLPATCEILVLLVLLAFALRSQFVPGPLTQRPAMLPAWMSRLVWLLTAAAILAVFGIPLMIAGQEAFAGLETVLRNRQMVHEILVALGFGLSSGVAAALVAAVLLRLAFNDGGTRPTSRNRSAQVLCVVLSLPGMIGSLVISLVLLWLFQIPVLNPLYDTRLPATLALVLFLLPRAFLLLLLLEAVTPQQSVHAARLLQSAPDRRRRDAATELLWQMRFRRHSLAAGILCVWGYLELTPVSILAPPGMTSAPVRLYNLMHYGRSMVLSAMVLLAMLAPILLLVLAAIVRKPILQLLTHLGPRRSRF